VSNALEPLALTKAIEKPIWKPDLALSLLLAPREAEQRVRNQVLLVVVAIGGIVAQVAQRLDFP
jgi:hypothetical protein